MSNIKLTDAERDFVVEALRTARRVHLDNQRALTGTYDRRTRREQHDMELEAHRLAMLIEGMDVSLATPPLSAEAQADRDEADRLIDEFIEEDAR